MLFKVTGLIRNGRWDNVAEEWELARITPRFFPRYQEAKSFFDGEIVSGTMWRKNEDDARNTYSVIETVGNVWPEGARAKNKALIDEVIEMIQDRRWSHEV